MGHLHSYCALLAGFALMGAHAACSTTVKSPIPAPVVASGYEAQLVASGLTQPRGIVFDSAGNLLVVESGKGLAAVKLKDQGGSCVSQDSKKTVVNDTALTHGLELSPDSKTLYLSSAESVYSISYNAQEMATSGQNRTLITGMASEDHVSRTLLLSKKAPGVLLVSRGSSANVDSRASDITSGISTIKTFNLNDLTTAVNQAQGGELLGWGLRNSVGIAEEPLTGGIYSVENSVDNLKQDGGDIHNDNPGEELNFHGYLNGTNIGLKGKNYGYPDCFSAWKPESLQRTKNITVGTQFAIGNQTQNVTDKLCAQDRIAPRLTFQAHAAPLDIKFDSTGSKAWITMHGSWNREPPYGYKLVAVDFAAGQPKELSTSTTAAQDILTNGNTTSCPESCFRPVGLAWDSKGRLFMSSDTTGEIYVITKSGGAGIDTAAALKSVPSSRSTGATSSGLAPRGAIPTSAIFVKALGALPLLV